MPPTLVNVRNVTTMTHPVFYKPVAQLRYFTQRLRKHSNVSHLANITFKYLMRENPYRVHRLCQVAVALRITEVKKHN